MKVYFISGHLDIDQEEFNKNYVPLLDEALKDSTSRFVVADARGTDTLAQIYLADIPDRVTLYQMGTKPRNKKIECEVKSGFLTDEERDIVMTQNSTDDIAWVRPEDEVRKRLGSNYKPGRISGTQKNLNRRKECSQN
jgi:hypothetical protein